MAAAPPPIRRADPLTRLPRRRVQIKARPGLLAKADHTSRRVIKKDRENAHRAALRGRSRLSAALVLTLFRGHGVSRGCVFLEV